MSTAETTIRHNSVLLNSNNLITNVTYNGTLEVSSGQPVAGVPRPSQSGSTWEIDLDCGRHGTSSVAEDFVSFSGGQSSNLFGLAVSFDSSPGDLNFFFGVNLLFTNQADPITVFLGQGSGTRNNWWIGSRNLSYQGSGNENPILTLPNGQTVSIEWDRGSLGSSVNTFGFSS